MFSSSLLAALAFSSFAAAQFAQFPDRDLYGSDISSSQQPSVQACQAECERTPSCRSYTAVFGNGFVQCYTKSTSVTESTLTSRSRYSTGFKGSCAEFSAGATVLAQSVCGTSNGYAVYSYYDQLGVADFRSLPTASALECQAECSADSQCEAYTSVAPPSGQSGNTNCYLKSEARPNSLAGNGFTTSAVGRCSDYNLPDTVACNNQLTTSAAARAKRNRRAPVQLTLRKAACKAKNETACALVKRDGTLGNGYECVDTSLDLDHCGGCHSSCSSRQAVGVLFSGCQAGKCQALACKAGYAFDAVTNSCHKQ